MRSSIVPGLCIGLCIVFCIVLAGCGMTRQIEQGEPTDAKPPPFNLDDALADCQGRFPDQVAQAVDRAGCVIKATETLRPLLPFPELLDQENALRKTLAEQVQSGQISLLQRNDQMSKAHMKLLEQEQARLQSGPAESAKLPIAVTQWRLSNTEACARLGGSSSNCY